MPANRSAITINRQLIYANALVCVLVLAAAATALWCFQAISHSHASQSSVTAAKAAGQLLLRRVSESILAEGNVSSRADVDSAMKDFEQQFAAVLPVLAVQAPNKELVSRFKAEWPELKTQIDRIMGKKKISPEDAQTLIDAGRMLGQSVTFLQHMDQLIADFSSQGKRSDEIAFGAMTTTFLLALAFIVLVSIGFYRVLTRWLDKVLKLATAVAAGDLTDKGGSTGRYEDTRMMDALGAMNGNLKNIVAQVRQGTDAIASASQQIAAGNQELSSRTDEQAASLQQTATAVQAMTGIAKQNAQSAQSANQIAASASEAAQKGGQVVAEVVETMSSINQASRKIVDIISVIDGIAFQTNILALNAAVEAARAGEQGRGFAVVAAEVRNLAQRSATAAREIKALIGDSVRKADDGSKLVDQAGAAMLDIVNSVRSVTEVMNDIADASRSQTIGIEEIHAAISRIDQVTQQNAALVEESAGASEAMRVQAGKLAQVVSVFKLEALRLPTAAA